MSRDFSMNPPEYRQQFNSNLAPSWISPQAGVFAPNNERIEIANTPGRSLYWYDEEVFSESDIVIQSYSNFGNHGNQLGVVFLLQNASNYMYAHIGSNVDPVVTVGQVVDGVDTVLSTDTYVGTVQNQEIRFHVRFWSSGVKVRVNNGPWLPSTSPIAFDSGKIGIMAQSCAGYIDDVRIQIAEDRLINTEDFDDGTSNFVLPSADWSYSNGELRVRGAGADSVTLFGSGLEEDDFDEFRISCQIKTRWAGAGNRPGFVFSYQDSSDYYLLEFGSNANPAVYLKESPGQSDTTALQGQYQGTPQNEFVSLAIQYSNANGLSVEMDGQVIFSGVQLSDYAPGSIGLLANNCNVDFDNFTWVGIALPPVDPPVDPPTPPVRDFYNPYGPTSFWNHKLTPEEIALARPIDLGPYGGWKGEPAIFQRGKNNPNAIVVPLMYGQGGWGSNPPEARDLIDTSKGDNGHVTYEGNRVYVRIDPNFNWTPNYNSNSVAEIEWDPNTDHSGNAPYDPNCTTVLGTERFYFNNSRANPYVTCGPGVRSINDVTNEESDRGPAGATFSVVLPSTVKVHEVVGGIPQLLSHAFGFSIPVAEHYTPPFTIAPGTKTAAPGEVSGYAEYVDERSQHGTAIFMKLADFNAYAWKTDLMRTWALSVTERPMFSLNGTPSRRFQGLVEYSEAGSVNDILQNEYGLEINDQGVLRMSLYDTYNQATKDFLDDQEYFWGHLYAMPRVWKSV